MNNNKIDLYWVMSEVRSAPNCNVNSMLQEMLRGINIAACYLAKLNESSMSPARSVALKTCKKSFINVISMPDFNYSNAFFDKGKI